LEKCACFAEVVFSSNINNDMAGVSKLALFVGLKAITTLNFSSSVGEFTADMDGKHNFIFYMKCCL
jgi:hypothetical protein